MNDRILGGDSPFMASKLFERVDGDGLCLRSGSKGLGVMAAAGLGLRLRRPSNILSGTAKGALPMRGECGACMPNAFAGECSPLESPSDPPSPRAFNEVPLPERDIELDAKGGSNLASTGVGRTS